ncbi:hypothetical protein quinque_001488 [Culex quinquefasciatus]
MGQCEREVQNHQFLQAIRSSMVNYLTRLRSAYARFVDIRNADDIFSHYVWVHGNTSGIGLHAPGQRWKQTLFRIISFVFALQQLVLVRDVAHAMSGTDDLTIRIGMCLIYSTLSMLQLVCMDVRYDLFLRVKDYFNGRRNRCCGGRDADQTRAEFFRQSRRNLLVAEIPVTIMSLIWAFFAREEYFHLVLNVSEEHQWIIDVIDQFYGLPLVYWNNSSWIISLSMLSMLRNAVHELSLIAESFATVFARASRQVQHIVDPTAKETQFWTTFDQLFRESLKDYEEFLAMIITLRKLMSLFFLLKVLTVESLLAVTCFTTFNITFQVFTALAYAIVFTIECFLLCKLVEQLNDQKESIGENLYHWQWPDWLGHTPERATRMRLMKITTMITAEHCQKTFRFRCGDMLDVSMEMFQMVLNTCYTLLTFLQATN